MRKPAFAFILLALFLRSPVPAQEVPGSGDSPDFLPDFTNEEKEYLARHGTVRVCVDPDWMPFESISNGKYVGMGADYLELISRKSGISFQLVPTASWSETLSKAETRECDILALAMQTPERSEYLNFTTPYIVIPLVIATTKDKPFIADLPEVIRERIGMVKDYAFTEVLKSEYPEMDIVEYETVYAGLEALEKGETYGFIDNLTTIAYEITRSFSSSLKISGRVERNWELGIAVRNDDPVLLGILDKAIRSIDKNAVQEIQAKWISVIYEQPFDYSLLWKVLAALGVVISMVVFRYRRVHRFNLTLKALNRRLRESEASFRSLIDNAHDGIAVVQNRRFAYVNPSVCALTGYGKDALLGLETFLLLVDPEHRGTMLTNHINRLEGRPAPVKYESLLVRADGSRCPIEMTGVLIGWNGAPATLNVLADISERKETEEAVRFMALHDNLTRLPNRYLLKERLERALAQARRGGEPLALLFMDLDDFKDVNDAYGHEVGDLLIRGVAERLQSLMRDSDTLARMGGDEFVILLPQVDGRAGAETLIARIGDAMKSPFLFDPPEIRGHVSVGYALFPEDGETEEDLLRVADQRMYLDKQEKKRD